MSDITKSKASQPSNPDMIKIGVEFVLKQCIYRGQWHNIYLAVRISRPELYYIIKLVRYNFRMNVDESKSRNCIPGGKDPKKIRQKYKLQVMRVKNVIQIFQKGDERLKSQIYHYQVYPKLGPSLKLCFQFMCQSFKIQTVCMIAIQIVKKVNNIQLTILEKIHSSLIVHRNLKPKKLLTQPVSDVGSKNELHLIDFRYATKYKRKNGKFFCFTESKKFQHKQFVNKFSSINTHLGLACSPKDDLESLGYILVYFLRKGILVPQEGKNKEDILKNVQEYKMNMVCEKQFKDLPNEINQYFYFIKMTNVNQYPFPDYDFLKKIFKSLMQKTTNLHEKDIQYEWINKILNINDVTQRQASELANIEESVIQESLMTPSNSYKQTNTMSIMESDEDYLDDTLDTRITEIKQFQAHFKDKLSQ